MLRYSIFFIFLLSCSQSFIEETSNMLEIEASISYDTTDTGILLKWESQWDFVDVEILRGVTASDLRTYQGNVAQTELLDDDTVAGQDYYYQINARNSKGRQIGASKLLKGRRSYRPIALVEEPRALTASQDAYSDKIELIWVGNHLDRFRVYRSDTENGNYTMLTELGFSVTEEFKYTDTNVKQASEYFYKVSAVGKDGDSIKEKYIKNPVKGSTLDAPTGLVATKSDSDYPGGIHLSWKNESGVDYYKVYRSSTTDGEYQMISLFVDGASYTDMNLPNFEGSMVEGKFTYPSYFYKVQSVKKGASSGLSASAEGNAINPDDYLEAPELNLALNKTSYPYNIKLSWTPIDKPNVAYSLVKVDNATQITHEISTESADGSVTLPNEAFDTRWTYVLRPINNNAGGIMGSLSQVDYHSSTPAPPTAITITTNAREYTTNAIAGSKQIYVYCHYRGKTKELNVGDADEWHVTSTVGNIALTWEKQVASESISGYNIYRRPEGSTEWTLHTNLTELTLNDTRFTPEEYQGIGSGEEFRYRMYEYQLTSLFSGQESAPTPLVKGSAINPDDLLPAPSHVSIPGHWAKGSGFGSATWAVGRNSPPDAHLIEGEGGVNHLYLVWGDVSNASEYRVRHSVGAGKENWYENRNHFPHNRGLKDRFQWFNNETSSSAYTHLYEFLDFFSYMPAAVSFDVAPVNGNAGNLIGDTRGILFREAPSNPF